MVRDQVLPSDRLKQRPRWGRLVAIAAIALLLIAGGAWGANALLHREPVKEVVAVELIGAPGKPTTAQVDHKLLLTAHVAKSTTPPPPPPTPENFYGNAGPVQCPGGTIAGAVDDYGNESNCQPTSNGQPCVEYNEANQCVAWYKP